MEANTNGTGTGGSLPNGVDKEALVESLTEEATVGYRPTTPMELLWATGGDMPQITLRRDTEFMRIHPVVETAMQYYKSGITGAEFWGGPDQANPDNDMGKPISPDPKVSQFVMAHCERFWQRGMPLLQEDGYPYGWCPGEHVYKEVDGMLVWSHLKVFHPGDGHILTSGYQPVGVRIKNIRGRGYQDLHLASDTIPAKACWYAHRPRAGSLYGRSQFTAAWLPWRMLAWRDGMDQVINAAVYRAGYRGPIVRHPPGSSAPTDGVGAPATRPDGAGMPRRENRDVARQLVEWAKAGAGFTLSSEQYPQAAGGGNKWDVEWPDHVMDVRPLIEAARWAEDRVMLGIGVPPELVKAGGTGSGYSGRSIPREAFLDGQQRIADLMLQMFVEQVLRPLVWWNFGQVPFNVQCKSILKSQSDDKQGEMGGEQGQPDDLKRSQAAKDSWALRKKKELGPMSELTPDAAAMSLDDQYPADNPDSWSRPVDQDTTSRALSIVRRVLGRRAA